MDVLETAKGLYESSQADNEAEEQALESTKATSTEGGVRSAGEIYKQMQGYESTALDSTVATSTSNPRSAEEIMQDMKEEKKAQQQQTASTAKSMINKWKNSGVNARSAATTAAETVDAVKDTAQSVDNAVNTASNAIENAAAIASGNIPNLGQGIIPTAIAVGTSIFNTYIQRTPAPTDESIAAYQKDQSEAKANGAHTKQLNYTNEQQMQWDAQDQHRMYSNYGNLYEHGENETNYNMAILNSAMAVTGVSAKVLSHVATFKQKYLSAVQKDDDQMDVNTLSMENIMDGKVNLLDIGEMQPGSEDLNYVNSQVEQQDAATGAEQINQSFDEATKDASESLIYTGSDRLARLSAELGLDAIEKNAQKDMEMEGFF